MTIDRWLVVGSILSGIVGPILGSIVLMRFSQQKPTSKRDIKIGWFLRNAAVVINIAAISYDIYVLVKHSREPITHGWIFLVATSVSLICFNLLSIGFVLVFRLIGRMLDHDGQMITSTGKILQEISDLYERIHSLEIAKFDKPTQEYLATLPEPSEVRDADI